MNNVNVMITGFFSLFALGATASDTGYIYKHGEAHLYCELVCNSDVEHRTTGSYRQVKDLDAETNEEIDVYPNMNGFWIDMGAYFDRVYLVSDETLRESQSFCESQSDTLKHHDSKMENWLSDNPAANCKIFPRANIALIGWITKKPYSPAHHHLISKSSVIAGIKRNDPYDIELLKKVEALKIAHPEFKGSELLNFDQLGLDNEL